MQQGHRRIGRKLCPEFRRGRNVTASQLYVLNESLGVALNYKSRSPASVRCKKNLKGLGSV